MQLRKHGSSFPRVLVGVFFQDSLLRSVPGVSNALCWSPQLLAGFWQRRQKLLVPAKGLPLPTPFSDLLVARRGHLGSVDDFTGKGLRTEADKTISCRKRRSLAYLMHGYGFQ